MVDGDDVVAVVEEEDAEEDVKVVGDVGDASANEFRERRLR